MDFHSFSQIKALVFILLSGFISSTKRQTLTIKRRRPDDTHLTKKKNKERKEGRPAPMLLPVSILICLWTHIFLI